jgi:hypothetical protein
MEMKIVRGIRRVSRSDKGLIVALLKAREASRQLGWGDY